MGQPNRAAGVAIALAIVVSFLPALILPYGNTDDYIYLAQAVELGLPSPPYAESVMHAAAAEGRPFWGTLVKPVFAAAGMIDNLRFVRIVTVAGIVALALLLYWALVRSKIGRPPAVLIALLVCTLPPFQLYASWAITFPCRGPRCWPAARRCWPARPWMRRVGTSTGSCGRRLC